MEKYMETTSKPILLENTKRLINQYGEKLIKGTITIEELEKLCTEFKPKGYCPNDNYDEQKYTKKHAIQNFIAHIGPHLSDQVLHGLVSRLIDIEERAGSQAFRTSTLPKYLLVYEAVRHGFGKEISENNFDKFNIPAIIIDHYKTKIIPILEKNEQSMQTSDKYEVIAGHCIFNILQTHIIDLYKGLIDKELFNRINKKAFQQDMKQALENDLSLDLSDQNYNEAEHLKAISDLNSSFMGKTMAYGGWAFSAVKSMFTYNDEYGNQLVAAIKSGNKEEINKGLDNLYYISPEKKEAALIEAVRKQDLSTWEALNENIQDNDIQLSNNTIEKIEELEQGYGDQLVVAVKTGDKNEIKTLSNVLHHISPEAKETALIEAVRKQDIPTWNMIANDMKENDISISSETKSEINNIIDSYDNVPQNNKDALKAQIDNMDKPSTKGSWIPQALSGYFLGK
jgi:hypothetical protein